MSETDKSFAPELLDDIAVVLNRYCIDDRFGTPDFLLAELALASLALFHETQTCRARWFGSVLPADELSEKLGLNLPVAARGRGSEENPNG